MFNGGSEISTRLQIGSKDVIDTTSSVGGYMKFESDDINKVYKLLELHHKQMPRLLQTVLVSARPKLCV
ncbi:hypothetical protein N483_14600 [Pseudoalteromonas luteoviolacea NCIMB 1944]|nr:hypothetical protein N483_14600 [Pseudoalteromonas luteoviolacea NCIMB 1944]